MKFVSNQKTTLLALLLFAAGVQSASAQPPFKMKAYWVDGNALPTSLQLSQLTNISYFNPSPNADGSISGVNGTNLSNLISVAHAANVAVDICITQFGSGGNFGHIAASSTLINTFANNCANLCTTYGADGVDLDWEFPGSSDKTNYSNLLQTLFYTVGYYNSAYTATGKCTTTCAVNAWNEPYFPADAYNYLSWINVMCYDVDDPTNSSLSDQATAYNYWVNGGQSSGYFFPPSQVVMGLPFYGAPADDLTFAQLLSKGASNGANNETDTFYYNGQNYYYNGIETVENKVSINMENRLGGMMIWQLSGDATGSNSLLTAMNSIVLGNPVPVGSLIYFQSATNNKYVNATSTGLIPNATTPSTAEAYTVVDESSYGQNCVALLSLSNQQFVNAGSAGTSNLIANASAVTSKSQVFYWYPYGYGQFQFQNLQSGLWVTAMGDGANALQPFQSNPASWEIYDLSYVNGSAYRREIEALSVQSVSSGVTLATQVDTSMSGSEGISFPATATGQEVAFVIPWLQAGSYDVKIGLKKYNTRGIFQVATASATNGTFYNLGSPVDAYASTATYTSVDLGTWTPGSNSAKWFKFTITGKNASSTGYTEMLDYITLTPQ